MTGDCDLVRGQRLASNLFLTISSKFSDDVSKCSPKQEEFITDITLEQSREDQAGDDVTLSFEQEIATNKPEESLKCEGEVCLTQTQETEEEIIKTSDPVLLSEGPTEICRVSDPRNLLKSDTEETENTSKLLEPRQVVTEKTEQNIAINFETLTEIDKTIQAAESGSPEGLSCEEISPEISVKESEGRNETLIPDSRDDLRVCSLSRQVSASLSKPLESL